MEATAQVEHEGIVTMGGKVITEKDLDSFVEQVEREINPESELDDILATFDLVTPVYGEAIEKGEGWRVACRMSSVAGVHVLDMMRFLNGDASLTWAARARLQEWASTRSSEVEREPYEIPSTTLPAKVPS